MIINYLTQLIGPVPDGYEGLLYAVSSVLVFYMIGCVFTLIGKVFKSV